MNRHLRIIALRLRSLWRGADLDRELDEELRYHVERQVDANIAGGMTPDEPARAALRAIGGVEQRKEEMRDTRGVSIDREPARATCGWRSGNCASSPALPRRRSCRWRSASAPTPRSSSC